PLGTGCGEHRLPYPPPPGSSFKARLRFRVVEHSISESGLERACGPGAQGSIAVPALLSGSALGQGSSPLLLSVVDELNGETDQGERGEDTQPEDPLAVTFAHEIGSRGHRQSERHAESECRDDVSHGLKPTFEQAVL